jgi:hypothetical protein
VWLKDAEPLVLSVMTGVGEFMPFHFLSPLIERTNAELGCLAVLMHLRGN